jgi:antitoxin component of MazEF toxin-antitoxin module
MGYGVKIQRVDRGRTKSFYVNFPAAIAEAANLRKGEDLDWSIEDRNTFVLRREIPSKSILGKGKQPLA